MARPRITPMLSTEPPKRRGRPPKVKVEVKEPVRRGRKPKAIGSSLDEMWKARLKQVLG